MTKKTEPEYAENEQAAFELFKFQLGQRVSHRVGDLEGIVVQRKLIQNQHGGTGHAYCVEFAPAQHAEVVEIALEAAEEEDGQS